MKLFLVTMVLTFSLFGEKAQAFTDINTGVGLLKFCEMENTSVNSTYCLGYVRGVLRGINTGRTGLFMDMVRQTNGPTVKELNNIKSIVLQFCIPQEVSMEILQMILLKYLKANLRDLHLHSADLIQPAFIEAFPCDIKNLKTQKG